MPEMTSVPKKPMTYVIIAVIAIGAVILAKMFAPAAVRERL